ncbi:hypothetical protein IHE45_20G098100 [Dioscorea alata]|uniref:Uncharacterized protein n=1 Tax=Dioscorea alata TaxID=55571 RepID=A0ACB7TVL9_DIOAL|nr:hypothetical protein IHE45_20G098100 [Dioscorea alata]
MASTSKELLDFSDSPSKPSVLESLLVSNKDCKTQREEKKRRGDAVDQKRNPLTAVVPTSQVLGKVKDFLGVMAQANEKLELDVKEHSRAKYDLEFLDGNEQECIEMDLLLGIADLHNQDAVAAAEAAMGNIHPTKSSTCSDCSSSDDTDEDGDESESESEHDDSFDKSEKPNSDEKHSLGNKKPNKRPKIVMLD